MSRKFPYRRSSRFFLMAVAGRGHRAPSRCRHQLPDRVICGHRRLPERGRNVEHALGRVDGWRGVSGIPGGLPVGSGDHRVPDRGGGGRGRAAAVGVGHVLRPTRPDRGRVVRRGRLRPLPPVPRGPRADARPRRDRVRVLAGLDPHPAPPAVARPARPAWTSTTGWSTTCWPPASRRWPPCTTGTTRSRWRTPAAGRTGTPGSGSPTTRRWPPSGSVTGSPCGSP